MSALVVPAADPMVPVLYRVARVQQELADTYTMELTPPDGEPMRPFLAGQFNMLYAFGVGEIPISISGDPTSHGSLVHTTRGVGMASRALCAVALGDVVGVRGPFGTPWPLDVAAGQNIVLVAGGIGLAPLRPALYAILAQRERYGSVSLLYGARSPDELLFRHEVEHWRSRLDLDVYVTVDRAASEWRGSVGVVTKLIPRVAIEPEKTVALVCGPEIMMRFTASELVKRGVSLDRLYVSMERNMKCAVGLCGHCQFGPHFICKDGPVFAYSRVQALLTEAEV
jgi:NAD(P)H-flavin reductase